MDYRVMPKFHTKTRILFLRSPNSSFIPLLVLLARRLFYFLSSISMPSRARANLRPSIVDTRFTTTPF
jgi:hypothetical protein